MGEVISYTKEKIDQLLAEGSATYAADSTVVHLSTAETITGVKTFTANPVLNAGAIPSSAVASLVADLAARQVAAMFDRPVVGSWYVPLGAATTVAAANTLAGCWLFVPAATPIDRIGIEVTTAGAVGDLAYLALYLKVPTSPTLNRVLGETAGLDIATIGFKEATVGQTLEPGRYLALLRTVTTGAAFVRGRTGAQWTGHYPADTVELSSDMRSGVHPNQFGFPAAPIPAQLTLTTGARAHAPLIYLRTA